MFDRSKQRDVKDDDAYPAYQSNEPLEIPESKTRVREAAVIGPSIQINGDLRGEEDLIIQGEVHGTIQLKDKSLTVGNKGKVIANVLAHTVIVEGHVKGDLYGAERVAIRKTGNVQGNIISPKVSLEEGGRFKGSIDMDEEAVAKAFGKSSAPAPAKSDSSPSSKPKPPELQAATTGKSDSASASTGTESKSGSAG